MFRRADWVTIQLPEMLSFDATNAMKEGDRTVGIIASLGVDRAQVHIVDNSRGDTIGAVFSPVEDLQFIKDRNSVPPERLATYDPNWIPRGVREGLL